MPTLKIDIGIIQVIASKSKINIFLNSVFLNIFSWISYLNQLNVFFFTEYY